MRDPRLFWSHFSDIRETVEARLGGFQGVLPACEMNRVGPGLLTALAAYDPALTLELERFEGIFAMIVGAGDDAARFASARELALAAPLAPGWVMRALRPRRDPGEALRADAPTLRMDRLRFAYGLANDRVVVMVLAEEAPLEAPGARFLARRLVSDLLGEEDYGLFVSDARLMRYADWLAATPGGRSWPIAELAARFDAIFHPPRRTWRPQTVQPQTLCA